MRHKSWDNSPRINAVAGYLISVGLPPILAYVAAYVGITMVTSWALKALAPNPDLSGIGQRGLLTNTREATAFQDIVYGEIRKGGVMTYLESTGDDNKYLHMIISMAGHEINSFEQIYINDETVSTDADGYVTDSAWSDDDGNKKILIKQFTGAANQNVYSTLSAITDGPEWQGKDTGDDTNFRGQGIACLYVRLEYDQDVFAQGIPLFTARIKGKKVEDPRTSTTAYSNNAALCIRDYLISKYGLDSLGDTNDTSFSTAANVCDESVALAGGGSENRYEINGVISLSQAPGDILADMMTSCAGTLFWGQGKWHLKAGDYTSSVQTFTLDDFRGPITLETKHSRRNNFNVVRGTFVDANQDYVRADYPEIRSTVWIAEDADIESAIDLSLPLTTSSAMAQRLAKMTLFRSREQMTMTADFSLKALDVEVGDIVAITNARYGMTTKEFEVVGWRFFNDGDAGDQRVNLTLRETSSAAFDWSAEEADLDGNDPTLPSTSSNLNISNLVATGGGRTTSDGTFINSVILSWTEPNDFFVSYYDVEWKATADSNYSTTTTTQGSIELSPLVDGVQYTIRVRAVTASGRRGPYSTVTFTGGGDTTAPGLPTSVSATGGFKYISIDWTNPADSDFNFVEIYENDVDNSSTATLVGTSSGSTFTRTNLGLSQTRYYYLKSVDFSGNKSAFTSSVTATTTYLDDDDFENGIRQIFIDSGLDLIEPVSSLPASGDFEGQTVYLTTDGKLYTWDSSAWTTPAAGVPDFSDLTGTIAGSQIPDSTITTAKIADDAITAAKVSANAIGTNELAANAVTAAKISAGTITGDKITANTITGGLLATSGIITSAAQIQNGIITNAKISDLSASKISAGTLSSGVIYAGDLNANNITAGTISVDRLPGLSNSDVITGGDTGFSTGRLDTQSTRYTNSTVSSAIGISGGQYLRRYNNYASLSVSAGSTLLGTATLTLEKNAGSEPSGLVACYFVLLSGSQVIISPLTNVNTAGSVTIQQGNYTVTRTSALAIESASSGTATMGFYFQENTNNQNKISADKYAFSLIEFTK